MRYEEAYFLGGLSWTPGGWEYRASAAALVRQSDSSLKIGGEAAASRLFFRGSRLEPLLGVGATIYQTDTMPFDEPGISLAPLLIVGTKEGYEEAYFLGGLSWTPGGWEYRASAAALVRQSDSSLKIGGEAAASRLFFRGSRLEPLLGVGATIYQTDTMPFDEPGISLAPLLIVGTKLNMASGISLRLEYRGVYGIFPSSFAGISFAPGS